MKTKISKAAKVALCRVCHGIGRSEGEICPQCEGSGRVLVSCEMTLDIHPFHPKFEHSNKH